MIGVLAFSFFIICGCWYCALIEKCCEPQRIWVDSKHPAVSFISIDSLFEKELYIQKVYCINRCTFYCPQQFISPSHPNNISNKMIHKCTKCEYQTPYKSNYGRHLKNKHEEHILPTYLDNISKKKIHRCNKCEYYSTRRYDLKRHKKNKHEEPMGYCDHSNYKSHINTVHTPQQTMLHCCCNSKDECGTRRKDVDMAEDQVRTLINNSFDVFQPYMKMQATGVGDMKMQMIKNITDVFKYFMLKKINE